jgi:hypothetical protein
VLAPNYDDDVVLPRTQNTTRSNLLLTVYIVVYVYLYIFNRCDNSNLISWKMISLFKQDVDNSSLA